MTIAQVYATEIAAAQNAGVAADPEAQLTVPVANLLTAFAASEGIGLLTLLREAQLVGVRPDFGLIAMEGVVGV